MSKASNKTHLSKLGFSDPDKQNKKHDLAIPFLAQESILEKIIPIYFKNSIYITGGIHYPIGCTNTYLQKREYIDYKIENYNFNQEYPLTTLDTKTIVGFVDGVISIRIQVNYKEYTCQKLHNHVENIHQCVWKDETSCIRYENEKIFIEVKITPEQVGSIIRQIRTYRKYLCYGDCQPKFLLVHTFPLNDIEVEQLERENIMCVKLGEQYDKWYQQKINETPKESANRLIF